jgi:flagellar basal-body rod protein FlgC
MMKTFGILQVVASSLEAQRHRMNTIVSNMANINTTRTEGGGPYRRKDVLFEVKEIEAGNEILEGVQVREVVEDNSPFKIVYDPGHPDADERGFVRLPNVNALEEMVNMMLAFRAYEASITAFNTTKTMFMKLLELGKT